jgi:hypothetical protein
MTTVFSESSVQTQDPLNETVGSQSELNQVHYIPYDLYSSFQYPWWCLNFFFIFWLISNLVQALLLRFPNRQIRKQFKELNHDKKNNAIIYVVQLLFTTVALIAQLYGSSDVIFRWQDSTTQSKLNSLIFAVLMIAVLYIWELIFRKKIGLPLLIHHLVTLLLAQLSTAAYFDTHDIMYMRYATLLGFHATVEQLSFMALFFFRLNVFEKWQTFWFFFATIQSLVFKTMVTVMSVVYYIQLVVDDRLSMSESWGAFWAISLMPLLACLYGAQVYACLILYKLGKRCQVLADFDNIRNSVMHQNELSDKAEFPVSKEGFREESVLILSEYETNQASLGGSPKLFGHPESAILLAHVSLTRSSLFWTNSNAFQSASFRGNTAGSKSMTNGTSNHAHKIECCLPKGSETEEMPNDMMPAEQGGTGIDKIDSHTFAV